eukprot:354691-Chlamydomonas_euryale.AAC.18
MTPGKNMLSWPRRQRPPASRGIPSTNTSSTSASFLLVIIKRSRTDAIAHRIAFGARRVDRMWRSGVHGLFLFGLGRFGVRVRRSGVSPLRLEARADQARGHRTPSTPRRPPKTTRESRTASNARTKHLDTRCR